MYLGLFCWIVQCSNYSVDHSQKTIAPSARQFFKESWGLTKREELQEKNKVYWQNKCSTIITNQWFWQPIGTSLLFFGPLCMLAHLYLHSAKSPYKQRISVRTNGKNNFHQSSYNKMLAFHHRRWLNLTKCQGFWQPMWNLSQMKWGYMSGVRDDGQQTLQMLSGLMGSDVISVYNEIHLASHYKDTPYKVGHDSQASQGEWVNY